MIVIDDENHWKIIFQRTHAQLAADIAFQVANGYRPLKFPFSSVLTAIADHDDGRQPWKGSLHLTPEGAPMDYRKQPLDYKMEQANQSITISQYRSPWIGLLTSMHQVYLYESFSENSPDISEFLVRQKKYQMKMIDLLQLESSEVANAYSFMLFCDELSLILCEGRVKENTSCEVGLLPHLGECIVSNISDQFTLDPWCLNANEITFTIFYYNVPKINFTSDNHLLSTFQSLKPTRQEWRFIKKL